MLPGLSVLDLWISPISPGLRTSCRICSVSGQWSGCCCSVWELLLNHSVVHLTALSCAAAVAMWDAQKPSIPQRHAWTVGVSVHRTHMLWFTFVSTYSGQWAFTVYTRIYTPCTFGRVSWLFLSKAAYGSPGEPWSCLYLQVHFFQESVHPELRYWFQPEDPTQLLFSLWRNVTGVFVTFYSLPRLVI